MTQKGFSLVELIIIVGIVAILATIGVPNYLSTRSQKRLELATEVLVRELNLTMERSRAQEDSRQWWVLFNNPVGSGNDLYYVCSGTSYSGPGVTCAAAGGNEVTRTNLGASLDFTSPEGPGPGATKEVVFAKATGLPTATVKVTISSSAGAGSNTITVNPNGSITF